MNNQVPETANKGLENIVACTTEVSTIHDTTLLFRGYTIEDLAEKCCFEEVIYLLWNNKLPNAQELSSFKKELNSRQTIPKWLLTHLQAISQTKGHPMSKLQAAVSLYGLSDPKGSDITQAGIKAKALDLTGSLSCLVAALSRFSNNEQLVNVDPSRSFAYNTLNIIRNKPPTEEEEKLFDTALILHADHELNASAFTARVVSSTLSDYYSTVAAAIGALKGSLHGGANEQVMLMLKEIGSYDKIEPFIQDALSAKKKVMGIGHRVYKNGDPRARILKNLSLQICNQRGLGDYHKMLTHIEQEMLEKKGLMPNVDFYSGLVYTALGLKPADFTPIFAISRITGWTAQIMEQLSNNRIYRPRGFYTGPLDLKVDPLNQRK